MNSQGTSKRILFATFGSLGDVQPFLAIGSALQAKGHQPVIATSAYYRDQVAAAGMEFAPVRPDRLPGQQDPDFLDRLFRDRAMPADIFRHMFLPDLRASLGDMRSVVEGADVVVAHPLASSARLAAEAAGLPWISAVMQPLGYISAHEPPVIGPAWIAALLRAAGPGATRGVLRAVRRITAAWTTEWHAIRAELGLSHAGDHPLWEGQHSKLLSLGLFPHALGMPQPDWPPQARVTGFPFYRAPGRALDPALLRFMTEGEPPLVFTLGTTAVNDPGRFYEESAEAALQLGLRAVLVVGPGNQDRIPAESSGILAVPFAPHDLVFPLAGAIVHQGGIGTLSEALCAGKPMLIMPYGHDQADNAWRTERLGVARIVSRRHYRHRTVARVLGRLLEDSQNRAVSAKVACTLKRERGAELAAELIERTFE